MITAPFTSPFSFNKGETLPVTCCTGTPHEINTVFNANSRRLFSLITFRTKSSIPSPTWSRLISQISFKDLPITFPSHPKPTTEAWFNSITRNVLSTTKMPSLIEDKVLDNISVFFFNISAIRRADCSKKTLRCNISRYLKWDNTKTKTSSNNNTKTTPAIQM